MMLAIFIVCCVVGPALRIDFPEKKLTGKHVFRIVFRTKGTRKCSGVNNAGVAQWLEHNLAKVGVEGSNLFARSI